VTVGHTDIVKMLRAFAATLVLMAACADPPGHSPTGPASAVPTDVPDVAKIVCEADGSTTIRTPEVLVQPDGVHVHVVSRLDEPASVGIFGRDVGPGMTEFVSVRPLGEVNGACYPFSQHDSGEEPPVSPIQVLDPLGTYVDGEIGCSGMSLAGIADFAELPLEIGPVPLEDARARTEGLREDDEVVYSGYPEHPQRPVSVRRDGAVVATFSFVTFDGEEWFVAYSQGCESSGIRSKD
jgi:hypothetical protein